MNDEPKRCPTCGEVLQVLLFLGITPDGFVCPKCNVLYTVDLKPQAHVIGEGG